jgi:cation transport ATPase
MILASLIRNHLSDVSFSMVAVALMLAGPVINRSILKAAQKFHWILRYLLLVVICSAGYGFLTNVAHKGLRHWLAGQRAVWLVLITAAIYLVLAWLARKQGEI